MKTTQPIGSTCDDTVFVGGGIMKTTDKKEWEKTQAFLKKVGGSPYCTPDKMTTKTHKTNWEKEIEKIVAWVASYNYMDMPKKENQWIVNKATKQLRSLLQQAKQEVKQELKKKVEGRKWKNKDAEQFWHSRDSANPFTDFRECHNEALDDILTLLEEYESKN